MKASELSHQLYYLQSAGNWEEALPVGSGRLGAMIWGGLSEDHLPLNEDTLWSGYPRETDRPQEAGRLEECRKLVAQRRFSQAQSIIEKDMLGSFTDSYMPAGNLRMQFAGLEGPVTGYRRELDLRTALARVEFEAGGVRYTREYFASCPDNGILIRFTASRPGQIHFTLSYDSPLQYQVRVQDRRLIASMRCPAHVEPSYVRDKETPVIWQSADGHLGMRGCLTAYPVCSGGTITEEDQCLRIEGADSACIYVAIRSSWNGPFRDPQTDGADEQALCAADIAHLSQYSWESLYQRHLQEYAPYYLRTCLNLDTDAEDLPTDERLRRFALTREDPVLYSLLFHYGRYLLIASSRPGTQPANLQGIWSHLIRPVWSSNFTININTEMNYWPAEPCNLPELTEPLFSLIRLLMEKGAHTAHTQYGARGSVSHHNTDLWGISNPVGEQRKGFAGCAFWNMSFGWLSRHLWDHYLYSGDLEFLRSQALPVLEAASLFYADTLCLNEDGRYIITPATSPENVFTYGGETCKVAREANMSQCIVREVFTHYLKALSLLNMDSTEAARIREMLPLLQSERLGSRGQILEWEDEYEENDPHHRHVSHLYGLHPAHQITPEKTPELAQACRRSLEIRGDDGTGWSLGWKINMWARLRDGDHALRLLNQQLRLVPPGDEVQLSGGGSYPNLLDAHPPFQIDGNFGACAGIAELLLQAWDEEIHLLPALPSAFSWQNGSILGLRAPHGITLDLYWRAGCLDRAVFTVARSVSHPLRIYTQKTVLDADFSQPGIYLCTPDRLGWQKASEKSPNEY